MSFKTDKSKINLNGRPKGSQNKEKLLIREFLHELIENNQSLIIEDFQKLDPKDRLQIVTNLLKYITPIQKEVDFENHKIEPITFRVIRETIGEKPQ
jgi:hypothetical protein